MLATIPTRVLNIVQRGYKAATPSTGDGGAGDQAALFAATCAINQVWSTDSGKEKVLFRLLTVNMWPADQLWAQDNLQIAMGTMFSLVRNL